MRQVAGTVVWGHKLVAICDDGTIWFTFSGDRWHKIAEIPDEEEFDDKEYTD